MIEKYGLRAYVSPDIPERRRSPEIPTTPAVPQRGEGTYVQQLRQLMDSISVPAKPAVRPIAPVDGDTGDPRSHHRSRRHPLPTPRRRATDPQARGELGDLLTISRPTAGLADLAINDLLRSRIEKLLAEQRESGRLSEHGLLPMRKLLLVGQPGTGKGSTAAAVAAELELPMLHLQMDSLITRFVHESAARLRLILNAMATIRGVYFFDQANSLAEVPDRANDAGETGRVRSCLVQFLRLEHPDKVLIVGISPSGPVDHGAFRHFDQVLEYPLPAGDIVQQVVEANILGLLPPDFSWTRVTEAALGLSQAEIGVASRQAAKDAILANQRHVTADRLIAALTERNL